MIAYVKIGYYAMFSLLTSTILIHFTMFYRWLKYAAKPVFCKNDPGHPLNIEVHDLENRFDS